METNTTVYVGFALIISFVCGLLSRRAAKGVMSEAVFWGGVGGIALGGLFGIIGILMFDLGPFSLFIGCFCCNFLPALTVKLVANVEDEMSKAMRHPTGARRVRSGRRGKRRQSDDSANAAVVTQATNWTLWGNPFGFGFPSFTGGGVANNVGGGFFGSTQTNDSQPDAGSCATGTTGSFADTPSCPAPDASSMPQ